jgi:hypothetical protein
MTGAASGLSVPPQQGKSGQPVVEILLAIFPKYQFEVPTLMLDMAVLTVAIRCLRMQSPPLDDPRLQFSVAGQALVAHAVRVTFMTLTAILDSLEKCMRPVQIPGRQLGMRLWAERDCHDDSTGHHCQAATHKNDQDIQP